MYKLVIVDDEQKILDGLADLFPWKNIGFEVVGKFTRANDALTYLEKNDVDVVMTDIKMPDINGLEFTKRIKSCKDVIIVILSSYSDYQYMRDALKLEVQDYLLKPIGYGELSSCFEKIKTNLDQKYSLLKENESTYYEKIINTVDKYLEEHFRDANLTDASEIVGISSNYLSRIYKENKGMGFQEYLNQIRMIKAAEMLMDPSYKSYEIAFLLDMIIQRTSHVHSRHIIM